VGKGVNFQRELTIINQILKRYITMPEIFIIKASDFEK